MAEKKTYVVKAYRLLTTYAKEWYEVEATSPEEAKELVFDGQGHYEDGTIGDIVDGEFIDQEDWEAKERLHGI